jgi:hypothetical protein
MNMLLLSNHLVLLVTLLPVFLLLARLAYGGKCY